MPMTADISAYLQENISTWISPANGTNPNGNIYESFLPDLPDRACCIYEMAGEKPPRTLGNNYAWESPRLRIVNRAPSNVAADPGTGSWPQAQSDAREIWDLLKTVNNRVLNGVRYILIDPIGNPQPLGLDANNRPSYEQVFSIMKDFSD